MSQWGDISLMTAGVGLAGALYLGPAIALAQSLTKPVVVVGFVVVGLVGISMVFEIAVIYRRRAQEFAAGYTSSPEGFLQYEQVDETTGLVLREAGEPALTRLERKARVAAFLAAQANESGDHVAV